MSAVGKGDGQSGRIQPVEMVDQQKIGTFCRNIILSTDVELAEDSQQEADDAPDHTVPTTYFEGIPLPSARWVLVLRHAFTLLTQQ
jgi:hypothetical protein